MIKLLASVSDVNAPDLYGSRPLHFAAMRGNEVGTMALLACRDVDVNVSLYLSH